MIIAPLLLCGFVMVLFEHDYEDEGRGRKKKRCEARSERVLRRASHYNNDESLPSLPGRDPKWGMGVRHALFPGPAFGALKAAGFPTLFSAANGIAAS
jgi:hypothetical protein